MSARLFLSSAVSGLEAIRIIGSRNSRLSCSANTREAISFAVPLTMIACIDFTSSCALIFGPGKEPVNQIEHPNIL